MSWMGSALAQDLTFHLKPERSRSVLHIQMLTLKHLVYIDPDQFRDSFDDDVLDTEHGLLHSWICTPVVVIEAVPPFHGVVASFPQL